MSTHTDRKNIRELAYQIWESRGGGEGHAQEDWLEAERQLGDSQTTLTPASSKAIDDGLKQTFPASDPPGSHLPDDPPANADAKWAAVGEPGRRKNSKGRTGTKIPASSLDGKGREQPEMPKVGSRDAPGG